MKYHPDRTQGDKGMEDKFKEIQEAYEILSDSQKRAAYDQYGHAGVDPNRGGGGFGGGADFGVFLVMYLVISSAVAEEVVNLARQVQTFATTELSLKKRFVENVDIRVPTLVECEVWMVLVRRRLYINLSNLSRRGQVQMRQGFFAVRQTTQRVRAKARSLKIRNSCHGHGRKEKTKTLNVKIHGVIPVIVFVYQAKVKLKELHLQVIYTFRSTYVSTISLSAMATICTGR